MIQVWRKWLTFVAFYRLSNNKKDEKDNHDDPDAGLWYDSCHGTEACSDQV